MTSSVDKITVKLSWNSNFSMYLKNKNKMPENISLEQCQYL